MIGFIEGATGLKKALFIGYYGYWVALTYLSIISAVAGIYFAFSGEIKTAILCMMFSGLCDTFDGRVASLKKRDSVQLSFGIQIDAMADLISFGVLPAAMLYSLGQSHGSFGIIDTVIPIIYVLTAVIRLAYFNATEMEEKDENGKRAYYEGLTTTSVALIIPIMYSACNFFRISHFFVFSVMLAIISILFVLKMKIPKPKIKTQIILCLAGLFMTIIM